MEWNAKELLEETRKIMGMSYGGTWKELGRNWGRFLYKKEPEEWTYVKQLGGNWVETVKSMGKNE